VHRTAEVLLPLVHDLGGSLIKAQPSPTGFRWLVVFGFPRMQEDAQDRARMLVQQLRQRDASLRFALSEGVAVNLSLGGVVDLVGDVLNTAARILSHTPWGSCWMSDRLAPKVWQHPGIHTLRVKGKARPLNICVLLPEPITGEEDLPPLIGRARERHLLHAWLPPPSHAHRAIRIAIVGIPGIGKSRLRRDVVAYAQRLGWPVVVTRARSTDPRPLAFVNRWLRRWLGLPPEERPELLRARLRQILDHHHVPTYHLPSLLWLMGGPLPQPDMDVQQARQQALSALLQLLSTHRPTLHVMEDLHWADPLSIDLLQALLEHPHLPTHAFLLIYRPETPTLPAEHELVLHPLSFPETLQLLDHLHRKMAPDLPLNIRTRRQLATGSGGIPLYIEELFRALLEGETEPPPRLEALIASRIDHLPPEVQQTLYLTACIGERASIPLLHACLNRPNQRAHLETLMQRGFLRRGRRTYRFRHDLIREVAYAQLLYRDRRRLHRHIARTMERLDFARLHPAQVAHHWREAGERAKAGPYHLNAARRSLQQGDLARARAWFDLAAEEMPTPREKRAVRRERILTVDTHFRGNPGIHQELVTLLREVQTAPDATPEEEARILIALALEELTLKGVDHARERLKEARNRFPKQPSSDLLHAFHMNAAAMEQQAGAYEKASMHLQQAMKAAECSGNPEPAWVVRNRLADLQMRTGHAREALHLLDEGLAEIPEDRPLRRAQYLNTRGNILKELGRTRKAEQSYRDALRYARLAMNADMEAMVLGNLGSILEGQGRLEEAHGLYEEAIALFDALGNRKGKAYMLGSLGVLEKQRGNLQAAREAFQESLRIARSMQHHMLIVRLLNSLGGLAHLQDDPEQARRWYHEALTHQPVPYMQAVLHINLAMLEAEEGKVREAVRWIQDVRSLLRQFHSTLLRGYAFLVLAHVFRTRKRPAWALRLLEGSKALFQQCRHPQGVVLARIAELHLKLDAGEKIQDPMEKLEESLNTLGAGQASELGRAYRRLKERLMSHPSAPHRGGNGGDAQGGGEDPSPPGSPSPDPP
jgi:predicted ATPase